MVTTEPTRGPLAGLTVVVTGGNGGIGQGIATACIDAGAEVMIWGRNEQKPRSRSRHCAARAVAPKVSAAMSPTRGRSRRRWGRRWPRSARRRRGGERGDARPTSRLLDMDTADRRRVIETNLTGVMHTFRAGARQMVEQGEGGSLLAVSSIVTRFGAPGRSHYAASKSAVHALVTSAAIELARHRIRCNSLAPGWTRTDLVEGVSTGAGGAKFEEAILAANACRVGGETPPTTPPQRSCCSTRR